MVGRSLLIGSLVLAVLAGTAGTGYTQSSPEGNTTASSRPGASVPLSGMKGTPESVTHMSPSHTRYDPDHSYYPTHISADVGSTPAVSAKRSARILMRVPANAEVWVDGVKTNKSGETRQFFSPPLTPGKRYAYDVRARWLSNGESVDEVRHVPVRAGALVEVHFTQQRADVSAANVLVAR